MKAHIKTLSIGRKFASVGSGLLLASSATLLGACNPVGFENMKFNTPIANSVTPPVGDGDLITPPVVSPPVVVPPSPVVPALGSLTKGACADDSSTRLLSCLNCDVPAVPVVNQFSRKGEALFEIMNSACQVRNGSDPAGYIPPTRAELMRRLNRLSPTIYPDTAMTSIQTSTINSLLTDPSAVDRMFRGLFQSGVIASTIAFETYFGIETIEARYAFCYASPANGTSEGTSSTFNRFNSSPLHSKAWVDCQYGNDPFNCPEKPEYITATVYRNQLRNGMNESINNPYVAPPASNAKVCEWEKYEGPYDGVAASTLTVWLASGFSVAGDVPNQANQNMCSRITGPLSGPIDGRVLLAAYRCQ